MNREILFRGKRVDNGEWIEGQLLYFKSSVDSQEFALIVEGCEWDNSNEWFNLGKRAKVMPETIGQYTGLTDKNGKKIFEGDIIRLDDEVRKLISRAGAKTEEELCRRDCLVGFKDGSFMFGRNKLQLDYFDSYLWLTNQYCEVIGNIFDKEVNQ